MLKLEKRGENGASQKERGRVPQGLQFLLSLIFLRHNKDGGYNSTNINKQLSPAQNTPALQTTLIKTRTRNAWKRVLVGLYFVFVFALLRVVFIGVN